MRLRSIGFKLALLAGVPVLGALVLSLAILSNAARAAAKAESLGSVDAVAELATTLSRVVQSLQAERAWRSMWLGEKAPRASLDGLALDAPSADAAAAHQQRLAVVQAGLAAQERETDATLRDLDHFLGRRELSRFPARLREPLHRARTKLQGLAERRRTDARRDALDATAAYYGEATTDLIDATAALTELSDDGELLRLISALVAVLELNERASQEHALLAYVFAQEGFPPGSYRTLVTVVTEQEVYEAVFRTDSPREVVELFDARLTKEVVEAPRALRQQALAATEEELRGDPLEWFARQQRRVHELGGVASELNARVRSAAATKRGETSRTVAFGVSLAGGVLLVSIALAFMIGRGISRGVTALRDATERVREGDLEVRVAVTDRDEIGELGRAFNAMIVEIAQARSAQLEHARMSRELEIAATIQRTLLPPRPEHEDFDFAGRMDPADEVGGDFYDVLTADGHLWLTVGDVSNHGLSAGLVMLMAQSSFAGYFASAPAASPDAVIRGVNRVLHANIADRLREDKYLTAQLLTYRGSGRFLCAGAHEWPIVFRASTGRCEVIPATGPWLGILPELDSVPVSELVLEAGDVLCLYSDGLIEARNEADEQFDVPRLRATLEAALGPGADLAAAVARAFDAVAAHTSFQDDDRSMLLVRRRGSPPAPSPGDG